MESSKDETQTYINMRSVAVVAAQVWNIQTWLICRKNAGRNSFDIEKMCCAVQKRWSIPATTYLWQMYPSCHLIELKHRKTKRKAMYSVNNFFFPYLHDNHVSKIFKNTQAMLSYLALGNNMYFRRLHTCYYMVCKPILLGIKIFTYPITLKTS